MNPSVFSDAWKPRGAGFMLTVAAGELAFFFSDLQEHVMQVWLHGDLTWLLYTFIIFWQRVEAIESWNLWIFCERWLRCPYVPCFGNMTNERVQWLECLMFDSPAFGCIFHIGITLQDRSAQGGPEAGRDQTSAAHGWIHMHYSLPRWAARGFAEVFLILSISNRHYWKRNAASCLRRVLSAAYSIYYI